MIATIQVPAEPNQTSQGTFSVDGTAAATQSMPYLHVVADPNSEIDEVDENNNAALARPATVHDAVAAIINMFPDANIRVTDGTRSVREQARVMLVSALNDAAQTFLGNYGNAAYASDMLNYLNSPFSPGGLTRRQILSDSNNPLYRRANIDALNEFTRIIADARRSGSRVSDHLDGVALDISVPASHRGSILAILNSWGARVLTGAHGTGAHWHISYRY